MKKFRIYSKLVELGYILDDFVYDNLGSLTTPQIAELRKVKVGIEEITSALREDVIKTEKDSKKVKKSVEKQAACTKGKNRTLASIDTSDLEDFNIGCKELKEDDSDVFELGDILKDS